MSKKIWKLAEKAGFVIWSHGEREGKVDWACDYDEELKQFYKLVRKEINEEYRKKSLNTND